jgi:RNA polymerase sigma-70 factor (ECF subfamily)
VNRSTEAVELRDRASAVPAVDAPRSEAFQRLVDEHLDRAYGLARAILRDATEAEDATHDAFVRAWRSWPSLRDPARFEAWFDRIVINTCRSRLRGSQRRPTDISDEIVIASGDPFGHSEDRDVIGAAIAGLSPDHRIVVALRFYRDLPIESIAARLGIPAGTVRSRLHYALRQLHDAIEAPATKGAIR